MGGHGVSFKILETRSPTLHTHNHLSIGALDEGIIMGNFLEHPEILISGVKLWRLVIIFLSIFFPSFLKHISNSIDMVRIQNSISILKYGSEEKGSCFYKCSIFLGFIMSKNLRGL